MPRVIGQSWSTPEDRAADRATSRARLLEAYGITPAISPPLAPDIRTLGSFIDTYSLAQVLPPVTMASTAAQIALDYRDVGAARGEVKSKDERNLTTAREIRVGSTLKTPREYGKDDVYFHYKDAKIKFTITNLPGNCGVMFISYFKVSTKGDHMLCYKDIGWDMGGAELFTKDKAMELYKAFLLFLVNDVTFHDKRTLFFTDAINGEQGTNNLSLWDMADKLKLPMSAQSHNNNSGNKIFNCWLNLDNDIKPLLEKP